MTEVTHLVLTVCKLPCEKSGSISSTHRNVILVDFDLDIGSFDDAKQQVLPESLFAT